MATCPCCSDRMLRHIYRHQIHWFCRSCWQTMPLIEPLIEKFVDVPKGVPIHASMDALMSARSPDRCSVVSMVSDTEMDILSERERIFELSFTAKAVGARRA